TCALLVNEDSSCEDKVIALVRADAAKKFKPGNASAAGAVANELGGGNFAAGEFQRVDQAGGGDDRGAVLIIMEDRHIEEFAQLLLDDEAFRRLDIFEINSAPALAEQLDAIDELVRVLGRYFQINGVDIGETLEQNRF